MDDHDCLCLESRLLPKRQKRLARKLRFCGLIADRIEPSRRATTYITQGIKPVPIPNDKPSPHRGRQLSTLACILIVALAGCTPNGRNKESHTTLLNVSYDPTRELYREFNEAFIQYWRQTTGDQITIDMSHGGAGKQARAIIDGLEADVATLALAYDIDAIAQKTQKLPTDWQKRLPHNSTPYTSTIVFLVRKGNPKGIKDWDDLLKPEIQIITPNPKTSGGARWNYLAAWAFALRQHGSEEAARKFVTELFHKVPVLDSGARGSTNTFVQHGIGDVLLAWENEAFLALKELGPDALEIVTPSLSILAEPPVTILDANTEKHGTTRLASEYLQYLFSPTGQRLAAKHFYRPVYPEHADPSDLQRFPDIELVSINDTFGGWQKAQATHFSDGGVFDQIFQEQP